MKIWKDFAFEAAHYLPNVPDGHPCKNMHGHSYKVRIWCYRQGIDHRYGWVRDYSDISRAMKPILERLDHSVLNEVSGLENPTAEVLCMWIHYELRAPLEDPKQRGDRCGLTAFRVEVMETDKTGAQYP